MLNEEEELTCEEWICALQEMESADEIGNFLVALWFIWAERNCHLWNNKKKEEWEIIDRAMQWLEEYKRHQLIPAGGERKKSTQWKSPPAGSFKINVDAAIFEGNGSGFGVVIRDANGECCLAGVKRTRRQWLPEFAEAAAISFGLEVAKRYNFLPGLVETDCLVVVQRIQNEDEDETEMAEVCKELRVQLLEAGGLNITFVGREANRAAHLMAHTLCNWEEEELWTSSPPVFLSPILISDCNPSTMNQ
ncbi:unnamed protein product [Linum trigynum]|uniref:RNase H type-1 domain-containing protein n=1 Tax=Linum trigynum TaxID=586398 RepID=A0AAV2DMS0_9ROSI